MAGRVVLRDRVPAPVLDGPPAVLHRVETDRDLRRPAGGEPHLAPPGHEPVRRVPYDHGSDPEAFTVGADLRQPVGRIRLERQVPRTRVRVTVTKLGW